MDSTAQKQTEPEAAVTPHPFHGRFRSIRINGDLSEDDDGDFIFDITPQGHFNSGHHTAPDEDVTPDRLDRREIKLIGNDDGREWHGVIVSLVGIPGRKIIVGTYHIPETFADEKRGIAGTPQDNGTWVATQP